MLLFLFGYAFAVTYEPVADQNWTNCKNSNFSVNYNDNVLSVNYEFCSINNQIEFSFIKEEIQLASKLIFEFAESIHISGLECAKNHNLEIYHIDLLKLNSIEFSDFEKKPGYSLYGVYDPRVKDEIVSTILITNHDNKNLSRVVFAHELSHYWFDRLCWNKTWGKDSESFALKFEKFYKRKEGIK